MGPYGPCQPHGCGFAQASWLENHLLHLGSGSLDWGSTAQTHSCRASLMHLIGVLFVGFGDLESKGKCWLINFSER